MLKVRAYQFSEIIDLKNFKIGFNGKLKYSNSDELFYELDNTYYVYVFKYGVICFLNFDDLKIADFFDYF